jgi:phosphoglycolate phosphatase-like HAD superfamily hydrolase
MKLVLFDVDGTLISTRGAGMRAYYRALHSVFNVRVDSEVIRPDGKTDPLIAREMLAYFNLSDRWCDATREALFESYLGCLEEEMSLARSAGLIRVLPGVSDLLEALSRQEDFAVGLVTGNLERGAHIKLEKAGLRGYFHFGGYGSDSEDRTELTRVGIRRGAHSIAPKAVEGAFVIGDTPLDITHGRAAGAWVIAVASAKYSLIELEACEPDLLVPDLTPAGKIISFMRDRSCCINI